MSAFTTPAELRMLDHYQWQLLTGFDYHVGTFPSGTVIHIPAGTLTDLASVPRLLWTIFPPNRNDNSSHGKGRDRHEHSR